MSRPRFAKLSQSHLEAIFRAGVDEFAAHGFHGTSLNRVIDAEGISKGSMYYDFDGKEDLYIHVTRASSSASSSASGSSRFRPKPIRTPSGRRWRATIFG